MLRVDLHCHLLPGVDDGPASAEESMELARAAVLDGTGVVAATPHVRADFVTDASLLPELVVELRARLDAAGVQLPVLCGGELGHDMVGRLSQGELETLALGPPRRRWLLVETPFEPLDEAFSLAADELRDRGFGVVLAHPERSRGLLSEGLPALNHELERGSMLQVNAFSILGAHGEEARSAAEELLRSRRAGLIASDAHGGWRRPALSLAAEAGAAERLLSSAPAGLLERGLSPLAEPLPA